ncbi:hypothetical protein V5799_015360 [Amblyomma americanum]|uniref:Uncharacterized protein n=1 Tax=Amblyomma americanum TaxID=6943 RepID=A0AAQ4E0D5_AMBAM
MCTAEEDADSSDDETEDSKCATPEDAGGSDVPLAEGQAPVPLAATKTKAVSRSPSCRCPRSEAPFSALRLVQSAGLANDEVPCICCTDDADSLSELQVQQSALYSEGSVSVQSRLESSVTTSASAGPVTRTVHVTTTVSSVSPVEPFRGGYSRRCLNSMTTVCVPLLVDRFTWQSGRVPHAIVRQPSIRRRSGSSAARANLSSQCLARSSARAEPDFTADGLKEDAVACANNSPRVRDETAVTVKELAASLKHLEKDTDEPIRFFFTTPSPTVENSVGFGATHGLVKQGQCAVEARPPSLALTENVWRCHRRDDTGAARAKGGGPVPKVPERPTDLPSKKASAYLVT